MSFPIVVDLGCRDYGTEESIKALRSRFRTDSFYGFDPNLDEEVSEEGFELRRLAAWTHDGEVVLAGAQNDATAVQESVMFPHPAREHRTVPCFDFSDWMSEHGPAVVKMDIEGAEFPILEKMIGEGTDLLIEFLLIEWHERYIDGAGLRRREIEAELQCPVELWP